MNAPAAGSTGGLTACLIATRSHLHLAHATAVSFQRAHPDAELHLVLVDCDPVDGLADASGHASGDGRLRLHQVTLDALGIPGLDDLRRRYSTFELCNAVKPAALCHVLARGAHTALYLDSDLWFEADVAPVIEHLADHPVVLTPHVLLATPDPEDTWRDLAIALRGSLNGGFVAVRAGQAADRFLTWWHSRVTTAGRHRLEQGLNCDQRWLDLVPGFDLGALVARDPGLNLAYWNLHERRIVASADDDGPLSVRLAGPDADGAAAQPLRFVHFSGFDPDDQVLLTRHWSPHTLATRPDLRPVAERYRAQLLASRSHLHALAGPRPADAAHPERPAGTAATATRAEPRPMPAAARPRAEDQVPALPCLRCRS